MHRDEWGPVILVLLLLVLSMAVVGSLEVPR